MPAAVMFLPLFIHWLQQHLLPCPFKYLTGVDCPGCGFQRAVLALLQGNLKESLLLYPAAMPIILFVFYDAANAYFRFDVTKGKLRKYALLSIAAIVLTSYGLKMCGVYQP